MTIFCIGLGIAIFQICTLTRLLFLTRRPSNYSTSPLCLYPNSQSKIYLVIPVLHEESIIEDTIRYFLEFCDENVELVIVTTEREYAGNRECKENTVDKILRLKSVHEFNHLHYPNSNGCKADQLNYFIKYLKAESEERMDTTFVAVYDADSRPEKDSLTRFLACLREHPNGNIFQQSSIFLGNLDAIFRNKNVLSRALVFALAFHQTRFVFAYEIPRYMRRVKWLKLLGDIPFAKYIPTRYVHCVGHGFFARASFLDRRPFLAGFPLEDLQYGLQLTALREPVYSVRGSYDICGYPETLAKHHIQDARWFGGLALLVKQATSLGRTNQTVITVATLLYNLSTWLFTSLWAAAIAWAFVSLFTQITSQQHAVKILLGTSILYSLSLLTTFFLIPERYRTSIRGHAGSTFILFAFFIAGPVSLALHSVGAWRGFFELMIRSTRVITSKSQR